MITCKCGFLKRIKERNQKTFDPRNQPSNPNRDPYFVYSKSCIDRYTNHNMLKCYTTWYTIRPTLWGYYMFKQ